MQISFQLILKVVNCWCLDRFQDLERLLYPMPFESQLLDVVPIYCCAMCVAYVSVFVYVSVCFCFVRTTYYFFTLMIYVICTISKESRYKKKTKITNE